MKNKAERRTRLGEIMADRGCKERQAMRVLAAEETGEAIPGKSFGPQTIGDEEPTRKAVEDYISFSLDPDEARMRIGEKGVSLRTFRRRVAKYVEQRDERSMETVST